MAPVRRQRGQQSAYRARQVELFGAAAQGFVEHRLDAFIVDEFEHLARRRDRFCAEQRRVRRFGQPDREAAGGIEGVHAGDQRVGAEEFVADEFGEVIGDACLVRRQDGRVRDRQAERVAEQRDDREPVGQRADHGGFGEGRDPRPGAGVVLALGEQE